MAFGDYEKGNLISKKLYLCLFGLIVFAVSSLDINFTAREFRLQDLTYNFLMFPQFAVYGILGFLHAYNVFKLQEIVNPRETSMLDLLAYFFVYTAWYNVVLLPESGLGYIEWCLVLFVFTSNFITMILGKPVRNPFMGQAPFFLAFLGIVLFFMKMILFYVFTDSSIYMQLARGNSTVRSLVFLIAVVGLLFLFMQLKQNLSNKFDFLNGKKSKKMDFLSKITLAISSAVKNLAGLLASFVSLPVLLIIGGVCLSVSVIAAFHTMNKFYYDIMSVLEPLLEKFTSTGENQVSHSVFSGAMQTISLFAVLFYTAHIENRIRKQIERNIENNIFDSIKNYLPKTMNLDRELSREIDKKRSLVNTRMQALTINEENFQGRLRNCGASGSIKIDALVKEEVKKIGNEYEE